jgi:hypothetical protein
MRSNNELLNATYVAFNARDIDTVLAMLHPEVDWPNGMEGGRLHGRAEVREYWTRRWSMIDPRVEPLSIADDAEGLTVVEVHQVVRDLAGTELVDRIVHHVYSVENGLIERMEIREPPES